MPDPVGLLRSLQARGQAADAGGARLRRRPTARSPRAPRSPRRRSRRRRTDDKAKADGAKDAKEEPAKEAKDTTEARPKGDKPKDDKPKEEKAEAAPPAKPHVASGKVNVIVVADADLLNDQFWVDVRDFLGQQVAIPNASNAAFVVNALDNLSGSEALIALRGRGAEDRPFKLVNELRRDAERRYREKEQALTAKLKEVQDQLAKLEKTGEGGSVILSENDRQAIEKFRGDMLSIRRELREVKRALREDIDRLDGWLKFANIALVPLLIGVGGIGWAARHRRRAQPPTGDAGGGQAMKPKHFAALAVITVFAVALALTTFATQNRWSQAKVSGASLFPGLITQSGKIAKIEIKQGDKSLTLAARQGRLGAQRPRRLSRPRPMPCAPCSSSWRRPSWSRARPATRTATRSSSWRTPRARTPSRAWCACSTTRATRSPRQSSARSASMPSAPARAAPTCASPATTQTWLSNADVDVSLAVRDWVQATVLDLGGAPKISKVTVEIPGEEPLVIQRDAADPRKYALLGIPDDKKLKEGAGLDDIARAVATIDLEDVRKTAATMTGNDVNVIRIEADGGLGVTLRLRKQGEDYWLALEAAGGEGEAKKTAEDIAKRVQGWEFKNRARQGPVAPQAPRRSLPGQLIVMHPRRPR